MRGIGLLLNPSEVFAIEPERLHWLRVTEPKRSIDPWLLTEPDRAIPSLLLLTEAHRTCCLLMSSERCWGLDEQFPVGVG